MVQAPGRRPRLPRRRPGAGPADRRRLEQPGGPAVARRHRPGRQPGRPVAPPHPDRAAAGPDSRGCRQDLRSAEPPPARPPVALDLALAGLGTIFVPGRRAGHGRPVHAHCDHRRRWAGPWRCWGRPAASPPGWARSCWNMPIPGGFDACQKQIGMVRSREEAAEQPRCTGCTASGTGGGPIAARLAAAEKDLASLEELLPLETRRAALGREAARGRPARARPSATSPRPGTLARCYCSNSCPRADAFAHGEPEV